MSEKKYKVNAPIKSTIADKVEEDAFKIIASYTKEYNKLSDEYIKLGEKHKTLMEVHQKTLKNEYNLTDKLKEQRLEIVEDLKEIIKGEIKEYGSYWFEIDYKIIKWEGKK